MHITSTNVNIKITLNIILTLFSRLNEYFINKAIEKLKAKNKVNEEKGILEKLLEIDKKTAVIMANEMLFAGVDTVNKIVIEFHC